MLRCSNNHQILHRRQEATRMSWLLTNWLRLVIWLRYLIGYGAICRYRIATILQGSQLKKLSRYPPRNFKFLPPTKRFFLITKPLRIQGRQDHKQNPFIWVESANIVDSQVNNNPTLPLLLNATPSPWISPSSFAIPTSSITYTRNSFQLPQLPTIWRMVIAMVQPLMPKHPRPGNGLLPVNSSPFHPQMLHTQVNGPETTLFDNSSHYSSLCGEPQLWSNARPLY